MCSRCSWGRCLLARVIVALLRVLVTGSSPRMLERSERAVKGKRMRKLIGEEIEKDRAFWAEAEALFAETASDEDFDEDTSDGDSEDSDIDDAEPGSGDDAAAGERDEEDERAAEAADARARKKRQNASYTDAAAQQQQQQQQHGKHGGAASASAAKRAAASRAAGRKRGDAGSDDEDAMDVSTEAAAAAADAPTSRRRRGGRTAAADEEGDEAAAASASAGVGKDRAVRASTRERSTKMAAALKERARRAPTQRRTRERVELTQEQRLEAAKETEEANARSLEFLLAIEEEKKRVRALKGSAALPTLRTRVYFDSATGERRAVVACLNGAELPALLRATPAAPAVRAPRICAVTGAPARYVDPETGKPFANLAAYRALHSSAAPPAAAAAGTSGVAVGSS